MKTIKIKTITLLIFLFGICFVLMTLGAGAQDAGQTSKDNTPEQRAQMQTNMMKTRLSLDSAQILKVQDINLKYAQKLDPVLKGDGGRFAKFRQMKSIQEQKNKELKAVFTKEQYKKYEKLEAEIKDKMKEGIRSQRQ